MVGGRLVINNPEKSRDAGKYVCVVSNIFGTVRSSEATLSFGCKPMFMSKRTNVTVGLKCPLFYTAVSSANICYSSFTL